MSTVKPLFENDGFHDTIDNSDWNGSIFSKTVTVSKSGLYRLTGAYLKSAGSAFGIALGNVNTSPRLMYITSATVPETIDFYLDDGDILYFQILGVAMGSSDNARYSVVKIQ